MTWHTTRKGTTHREPGALLPIPSTKIPVFLLSLFPRIQPFKRMENTHLPQDLPKAVEGEMPTPGRWDSWIAATEHAQSTQSHSFTSLHKGITPAVYPTPSRQCGPNTRMFFQQQRERFTPSEGSQTLRRVMEEAGG